MEKINETIIQYFFQPCKVNCDRKCNKAWGKTSRPSIQLSEDENDYCYLSDDELKEAPIDPGTYEGFETKPESPDEFPNKWCVRECERCNKSNPKEYDKELKLKNFSKRIYNINSKNT